MSRKTRKSNPTAVPLFRSGRRSLVCARLTNRGKVGVQRGRENAGVPSFLSPPRKRQFPRSAERNSSMRFSEKLSARKGRSAYAPRASGKASAEGKRKASHFREWLLVEVTGLEPVTLCRLADDEPSCNREKEKALTFVSA